MTKFYFLMHTYTKNTTINFNNNDLIIVIFFTLNNKINPYLNIRLYYELIYIIVSKPVSIIDSNCIFINFSHA